MSGQAVTPVLCLPGRVLSHTRGPGSQGPRGWPAASQSPPLLPPRHCASSVLPPSTQGLRALRCPSPLALSLGRPDFKKYCKYIYTIPLPPWTMTVFQTLHLDTSTSLPEPRPLPRQDSPIQIFVWLRTFWPPLHSLSLHPPLLSILLLITGLC